MPEKKIIENLQKKIEQADALAVQKSNFLATMSHEIRTPMQTIYGLLELIAAEKPDANIESMVKTAQDASSGLLEILDDILDFAKMDADAMDLDVFEVPVRLLVRGILEALSVKAHGSHVELIDDIGTDVPFVVLGDPKRLRQILMNLCSNALKFTRNGHVIVRVSTQTQVIDTPESGVGLRFEVIDGGIGIPPEICETLFSPFTQADNTTSRRYGGTGLGLSISKKLIELMNGKIGVTSIEGMGSTFWFEIPTEEISTDEARVNLPNLEGISVLCVEDHPQGAREIVSSLRSMGAKVEHCKTYAEGHKLATHQPFDVAVIDQGLPDGLGIDLIRDILEIRPFTGMVMYTVREDIGLSHSLSALGAIYLTKPASRVGLGEAVKIAAPKHQRMLQHVKRLLIAEDTQSIRDVLQRQFDKLDINVDFVTNGVEALKALKTREYGLLLTDLHMPEMDGYTLIKKIRHQEQDTQRRLPVIVLTADVQMAQRESYIQHDFDECLLKPVTLGQLKGLLTRWNILDRKSFEKLCTPDAPSCKTQNTFKHIDRDCLIANIGRIDRSAIEMMRLFIEMTEPLIHDIHLALDEKNHHDLSELGHSLKGAARSACCNILGELADQLQQQSAQKNECNAIVINIEREFLRIKEEVAEMKPEK
ncbi:MAG: response regulator [Alphaproteobacteria bacterium]